jgi:hypothetical protein
LVGAHPGPTHLGFKTCPLCLPSACKYLMHNSTDT